MFELKGLFLFIAIGAVVFIILREFMAWYWKTNQIIDLLEDIKKNTKPKDTKDDIKDPKF